MSFVLQNFFPRFQEFHQIEHQDSYNNGFVPSIHQNFNQCTKQKAKVFDKSLKLEKLQKPDSSREP